MNVFRLSADMTHLLAIMMLLWKIHATQSCKGLSLQTQVLYELVFLTRYIDLLSPFKYAHLSLYKSWYLIVMKLIYLSISAATIYCMRCHSKLRQTCDKEKNTYQAWILICLCFILALLINQEFSTVEILWTFSLYLEAVAILPQLLLLQQTRNIDNYTGYYILLLGAYRALYGINWIYRAQYDKTYWQPIVWASGAVQSLLYLVPSAMTWLRVWRVQILLNSTSAGKTFQQQYF